jgi:hypothetical protein
MVTPGAGKLREIGLLVGGVRQTVTAKVRFQTTAKNRAQLERFEEQGVLIECGYCSKCATITRIETLDTIPTKRLASASCTHCGKAWHLPFAYSGTRKYTTQWNSLPLWLATSYRGNPLWALNESHLTWLEAFISADVREDKIGGSSALHAILPRWMTAAKNRKGVVKALAHLRVKLEAAGS